MANFTKKAIKETFIGLLEDKPLSDITVKDIVETCGINRNSFYYHFHDLPELIEEIVKEDAEEIIMKYPSIKSMVECYDASIEFASRHKRAIMHIYRSVNREVFERYLMEVSEYFIRSYLDTAFSGFEVREDSKQIVVDYYKCVGFGLVIDWLNKGMTEEYAQKIRKILVLRKDMVLEIAEMLQKQD